MRLVSLQYDKEKDSYNIEWSDTMESKELLKMLLDEDAYVQDINIDMNTDGFTDMVVKFRLIPKSTGIPRIKIMGKKQHDKIKELIEPLEDELFQI